jgi:hypothetical protein
MNVILALFPDAQIEEIRLGISRHRLQRNGIRGSRGDTHAEVDEPLDKRPTSDGAGNKGIEQFELGHLGSLDGSAGWIDDRAEQWITLASAMCARNTHSANTSSAKRASET